MNDVNNETEIDKRSFYADPFKGEVTANFPVEFQNDKRYLVIYGITFGVFFILSAWWFVKDDSSRIISGSLSVLMALFAGSMFLIARKKISLRLDETGFKIVGMRRDKPAIQWNEIESFDVTRIGGNDFITYQFKQGTNRTRWPGGVALPINHFAHFQLNAVVSLMEACRLKFGTPTSSFE